MAKRRKLSAENPGKWVGFVNARTVKIAFTVTRGRLAGGFLACVKQAGRRMGAPGIRCARGKNPRVALARVMRQHASEIARRKGAFAGMKGGR